MRLSVESDAASFDSTDALSKPPPAPQCNDSDSSSLLNTNVGQRALLLEKRIKEEPHRRNSSENKQKQQLLSEDKVVSKLVRERIKWLEENANKEFVSSKVQVEVTEGIAREKAAWYEDLTSKRAREELEAKNFWSKILPFKWFGGGNNNDDDKNNNDKDKSAGREPKKAGCASQQQQQQHHQHQQQQQQGASASMAESPLGGFFQDMVHHRFKGLQNMNHNNKENTNTSATTASKNKLSSNKKNSFGNNNNNKGPSQNYDSSSIPRHSFPQPAPKILPGTGTDSENGSVVVANNNNNLFGESNDYIPDHCYDIGQVYNGEGPALYINNGQVSLVKPTTAYRSHARQNDNVGGGVYDDNETDDELPPCFEACVIL